jgi:hypothetical protein
MRTRLSRLLTVFLCTSVLFVQAAVSSGAMQVCRCNRVGKDCCQAKAAAKRSTCCCTRPAEKKPSCCPTKQADLTQCKCPSRADEPQLAERPRVRVEPVDILALASVDVPGVAVVDFRQPSVQSPAIWPPGVRLQSLFCTWLI